MAKATKQRTPYGTKTVSVADGTTTGKPPTATPADYPAGINIADFRFRKSEDVVNHPNHYAPNGRDSFMHMKDQMGKAAFDGFLQGNAIKYVQRYKFKGKPVEDLTKAAFYLFHLAFEAAEPGKRSELREHLAKTLDHAAGHFGEGAMI